MRDVEDAAYNHPAVRHASVVLDAGKQVRCFVELNTPDTADEQQIAEHIRAQVPESLIPAGVHILPTFPRTFSGKADRLHLSTRSSTCRPVGTVQTSDKLQA